MLKVVSFDEEFVHDDCRDDDEADDDDDDDDDIDVDDLPAGLEDCEVSLRHLVFVMSSCLAWSVFLDAFTSHGLLPICAIVAPEIPFSAGTAPPPLFYKQVGFLRSSA